MNILLNGEPKELPEDCSLLDLLVRLGLAEVRVAVERNREIVPAVRHSQTPLQGGDQIEIVTFVGGG